MKQFKLTILLTMLMSMVGVRALAADGDTFTANVNYIPVYFQVVSESAKTCKVYKGFFSAAISTNLVGDFVIPSTVNGYSVVGIGQYAFYNCQITGVTIPSTVTTIESNAFSGCNSIQRVDISNLSVWCQIDFDPDMIANPLYYAKHLYLNGEEVTNLSIPSGVTKIGSAAFQNCESITSITIPNSVKTIGNRSFTGCGITTITIPNGVETIKYGAFIGCTKMKNISLPNTLSSIGGDAFRYCIKLEAIIIPEGITTIEANTFTACYKLKSISFPRSLTEIKKGAFSECEALVDVYVPNIQTWLNMTMTNAYPFAYYHDNNTLYVNGEVLENLTIPEGTTSILSHRFSRICSIKSVTIPNSVTNIGEYAFYDCNNLENVTLQLPSTISTINSSSFYGCRKLTEIIIPKSVESIGTAAFSYSGLTSVIIPNGVTSIGGSAFADCNNLLSVKIPRSITSIGNYAFFYCPNLSSFIADKELPLSIESGTFEGSTNATLYVPYGSKTAYEAAAYWQQFSSIEEMEAKGSAINFVDANVKALCIANWDTDGDGELREDEAAAVTDLGTVFKQNTAITSFNELQYFTGLTSIGNAAFSGCSTLASITIPNNVTSIGNSAFKNCNSLTSIAISNSVISIGSFPFQNCSSLTSIIVGSGNPIYDSRNNCNAIIETASNTLITGCKNTTIPSSVTSIGSGAFSGCSSLTSITIPNSITTIGNSAFQGCNGLNKVIVPDIAAWCNISFLGVNYYGERGYYCYSNPLTYAKHLYSDENTEITQLIIPKNVTTISSCAFISCSSLTSIIVPNSVTSIGEGAFYQCYGLNKVIVSDIAAWCQIAYSYNYDIDDDEFECSSNPLVYAKHLYSDENTEITQLFIPNKVTSISSGAFSGCNSISSVFIPSSVTSIGKGTFWGCSALNFISISNSVTYMEEGVFYGCTSLTSIDIPTGVSDIEDSAFGSCSGLTSVTIPSSVTNINPWAFNNCNNLTSATVEWFEPISITSYTFSNRANATLYVPKGSKSAYEAADYWKEFKEIVELPDGKLFFEGTTVRCGSQSVIPVLFESEAAYGGLQCEVTLPAGITLNKVSKTARLSDAFTLTKSLTGDNTYQILLYNTERATFAGNDGALFTMTVDVADNMAVGNYDVTLSNIVVSDVDNNQTDLRDCTAMLRVENYLLGDANRDNRVNVTDIMAVANKILKYDVPNFNEHAADVNFDNRINVTDIMGIANIILKINTAAHAPAVQLPEPQ